MWEWVVIFISMAVSDFLYARWTLHVGKQNPIVASLYAFAVIIAGGYTVLLYTHNGLLIIPAAVGASLGTYASVRWAPQPPQ